MINWKACKPLESKEMEAVAREAVAGNSKAIEKLVSSNIKLASSMAHSYKDFDGLHVDDLTGEAVLGLIEAIPYYKAEKGTKFTTYASWHMKRRILNYIIDNFRMVRIGTTQEQRKIFWRLNRETAALIREGIDPSAQALADRLEVRQEEVEHMQVRMNNGESSLDATNPGDETGKTILDTLQADNPSPEQYTTARRMSAWVQNRMIEFEQRLNEKEQVIWNCRIAADNPLTAQQTGERIGATRQHVSHTEIRLREEFVKYARNQARD
jgi:RNA polymerase sigma-32 factor